MNIYAKSCLAACGLAVFILMSASPAFAGNSGFSVGALAGAYTPYVQHNDVDEFDAYTRAALGLSAGFDLGARAMLGLGFITAPGKAKIDDEEDLDFNVNELFLDFYWSVLTGMVRPRFLAGGSYQMIQAGGDFEDQHAFGVNFGLGIEMALIGDTSASLDFRYHYLGASEFSSSDAGSALFGVNYRF